MQFWKSVRKCPGKSKVKCISVNPSLTFSKRFCFVFRPFLLSKHTKGQWKVVIFTAQFVCWSQLSPCTSVTSLPTLTWLYLPTLPFAAKSSSTWSTKDKVNNSQLSLSDSFSFVFLCSLSIVFVIFIIFFSSLSTVEFPQEDLMHYLSSFLLPLPFCLNVSIC